MVALWIDKDYHLTRFPAKLTHCQSHNDFIIDYMDAITLRILLHKPDCLQELLNMTQANSLSDILTMVSYKLILILIIIPLLMEIHLNLSPC